MLKIVLTLNSKLFQQCPGISMPIMAHLTVAGYICSSRSNAQAKDEGPLGACAVPAQNALKGFETKELMEGIKDYNLR